MNVIKKRKSPTMRNYKIKNDLMENMKNDMPAHDHTMMGDKKQGTQYTCPMHPEIISDKPGKCSKCGMTLVKKN